MIRRLHVRVLVGLAFVAACTSNPVGRLCDLGAGTSDSTEVVITSPSLDCVSRTCLSEPESGLPENKGLCTANCSQDSDCDRVPESPCMTGFTCGVAVTVGPFCCEKFCICKDYIVVPDTGELTTPAACDASNAQNACCNLSGRVGDATDYPACNGITGSGA